MIGLVVNVEGVQGDANVVWMRASMDEGKANLEDNVVHFIKLGRIQELVRTETALAISHKLDHQIGRRAADRRWRHLWGTAVGVVVVKRIFGV